MVALTAEEIAVMRDEIAKGLLPPDAIEKYLEAEALNVFGHDARRDRDGNWIEQGIGPRERNGQSLRGDFEVRGP